MPASAPSSASQPSTLDELAFRVRKSHHAAQAAWSNALDHLLDAGDALNEAQSRVSSNWKRWVRENCFLGVSTALLYQQLARHRSEIKDALAEHPDLSLRAARRLIAKPKPTPAPELEPADNAKPAETPSAIASTLDSATWSSATLEERQRFLAPVPVRELLEAMSESQRAELERCVRSMLPTGGAISSPQTISKRRKSPPVIEGSATRMN
jgi:hypothetical protein